MDHKLENLKADFKRSIPTSFTEQDKQAVMRKIKKPKLERIPNFLPKTLSFIAFAVACLFFIVFIFSSDSDLFNLSREDSAYNSNEETAAMNGNDAADVDEPDIIGYVMEIEGDSMLVVADEPDDFSAMDGENEHYAAILFDYAPEDIQVGEYVKAWADDGIADSYPGQASLGHLEVIEVEQREGAKLSEAEAIRNAIKYGKEQGLLRDYVNPIRTIDFDANYGRWTLDFFSPSDRDTVRIRVDDINPIENISSSQETFLTNLSHIPANSRYAQFYHDKINIGDLVGMFNVMDLQTDDESTLITFESNGPRTYTVVGDIYQGEEWLFKLDLSEGVCTSRAFQLRAMI